MESMMTSNSGSPMSFHDWMAFTVGLYLRGRESQRRKAGDRCRGGMLVFISRQAARVTNQW